jgi:hypothetical protein
MPFIDITRCGLCNSQLMRKTSVFLQSRIQRAYIWTDSLKRTEVCAVVLYQSRCADFVPFEHLGGQRQSVRAGRSWITQGKVQMVLCFGIGVDFVPLSIGGSEAGRLCRRS